MRSNGYLQTSLAAALRLPEHEAHPLWQLGQRKPRSAGRPRQHSSAPPPVAKKAKHGPTNGLTTLAVGRGSEVLALWNV